ncbi:2-C-methyl-D-erythritol 4-phosphate cytidylyltransferase [Alicyclobacillaceae bacterium I2511]|nr:2-C-methyl-D-erythritol 4-phosphate cytidylyltransferase [Alicyclobacillaceae bacterium I2511]
MGESICGQLSRAGEGKAMTTTAGIVVAAGQGSRFGGKKQFFLLAGEPVWRRSTEALVKGGVEEIWVTVPAEDVIGVSAHIASHPFDVPVHVLAGGRSRAESVGQAVLAATAKIVPGTVKSTQPSESGMSRQARWLVVHDAARPFVSPADVERVIAAARQNGGAILARPVRETVKRVEGGQVAHTVSRKNLWLAETPQVFAAHWMREAYQETNGRLDWETITDDASLIESLAHPVTIVACSGINLKITEPVDWELAQWLAVQRWGKKSCV